MIPNLAPDSVLSLIPAAPGWTVTIKDLETGESHTCPLIGWAVVLDETPDGQPFSRIEPAFYYQEGGACVWLPSDVYDVDGLIHTVNPPRNAS